MAELKSLIVNGVSRLNSTAYAKNIYADKFITNGGTASQFVMGDGTLNSNSYSTTSHTHDGRYLRWGGSAADVTAMAWGTLTTANGYSILSHASSGDGGDWGMAYKSGQIFMQLDGYYYQNEGAYRVTDVSETVTALGISGNYLTWTKNGSTSNITVPYATSAGSAPASDVYSWAKASTKPSYTWDEITGKPSTFTPSSHNHSQIVTEGDNRSTATTPNDYANKIAFRGLKNSSTIGSPSSDSYSYLVGLRGWSDSSGGNSHEIAFNDTGIYHRSGSTTTWGNWLRFIDSGNIGSQSVNYATSAGSATSATSATNATNARYVIADNNAKDPGYALLQSGSGRTDASPAGDTWIFYDNLGGTSTPWGIKHTQGDNRICFFGGGTNRAYIDLSNGNIYSAGTIYEGGAALSSKYAALSHTHNYAGSSSAGGAATNAVVNDSNANSTYRIVWHSGNTLYSTDGIYCNPSTDALTSKIFRSTSSDIYGGSGSGSQYHLQYDSSTKCVKFLFD